MSRFHAPTLFDRLQLGRLMFMARDSDDPLFLFDGDYVRTKEEFELDCGIGIQEPREPRKWRFSEERAFKQAIRDLNRACPPQRYPIDWRIVSPEDLSESAAAEASFVAEESLS